MRISHFSEWIVKSWRQWHMRLAILKDTQAQPASGPGQDSHLQWTDAPLSTILKVYVESSFYCDLKSRQKSQERKSNGMRKDVTKEFELHLNWSNFTLLIFHIHGFLHARQAFTIELYFQQENLGKTKLISLSLHFNIAKNSYTNYKMKHI